MGTRSEMLRKFLTVVGFGSIIFGVLFFILTLFSSVKALSNPEYALGATFWDKTYFILTSAQMFGFQMFNAMTLGGICLYLVHKLKTETEK